jgi:hypothetical protein
MVNRESLPLILGLLIPLILAGIILLYYYGYDVTLVLRQIPLIYYVIIFPIALGFTVAIIKYMKPD